MPEMQTIPARHGVATFVPAGQTIKIVNTSGHQVVDTWAFALPHPDVKNGEDQKQGQQEPPKKEELSQQQSQKEEKKEDDKPASTSNNKKNRRKSGMDLPTQEEAEKATKEGLENGDGQQQQQQQPKKSSWSSYVPSVPSIGWSSSKSNGAKQTEQQSEQQGETEKQKNSRTWGSYMPSGKGYTNYIPKSASDTVASFASTHQRDPNKSYVDQLRDFSTTPVGAAGIKAISGSGYGGSLFAGYQAWNAMNAPDAPAMEFLSIPHTRASTKHMVPKVNDLFVSNLREPMLTLVEDASSGTHDTLMAACDPARYRQLGVDHWEEHGSCAENLVLALKELNERAGLKGAKGVGADVTINNVPAPLNLFMNVPWDDEGDISFKSPKTKSGDFVRLRAERDIVVVMSACPQDVTDINNKNIRDAHFLVEGGQGDDSPSRQRSETPRRRPQPRKINSGQRAPSTVATGEMGDDDKSQVGSTPAAKKPVARKTTAPAKRTTQNQAGAAKKPAPVAAAAAPKKKAAGTPANSGEGSAANGSAAAPAEGKPVEKKKPRKLVRKE